MFCIAAGGLTLEVCYVGVHVCKFCDFTFCCVALLWVEYNTCVHTPTIIAYIITVDYGEVQYHISSGGNHYIYTDIKQFGLDLHSSSSNDIKMAAYKLKKAVEAATKLSHPGDDRLSQLSGVFFYSGSLDSLPDIIDELCIYKNTVGSRVVY